MIGGVKLFLEAFAQASTVYETIVQAQFMGDTNIPNFDFSEWETELLVDHSIDEQHQYPFKVLRHRRQVSNHRTQRIKAAVNRRN